MDALSDLLARHIAVVYFVYGLAFFSMGLAVALELGRASGLRFAGAMWLLSGFGLIHGSHEWLEMALIISGRPPSTSIEVLRVALLAVSFLSLAAFGLWLLRPLHRPVTDVLAGAGLMVLVFLLGVAAIRLFMAPPLSEWLTAADVWCRYSLGIPGALLAALALLVQRRPFRELGLPRFQRDVTGAALALAAYGVVGQLFGPASILFPSTVINGLVFFRIFGVPVQLFRAAMAAVVAVTMVRALHIFDLQRQRELESARAAEQHVREETERLHRELQRREALRGQLLHRAITAQEEERRRIARELHDETGQVLTALAVGLGGIEEALTADPALAKAEVGQLKELSMRALTELRQLVADLRPTLLDDLGLVPALRWYAKHYRDSLPTEVSVEVGGERRRLPSDIEIVLFRIAQEALSNVARHAVAEHATIRLDYAPDWVLLTAEDDGKGFEPEQVLGPEATRRGWGLVGIHERVTLAGGSFDLQSQPGVGTTLTVRIPLIGEDVCDVEDQAIAR